MDKENIYQKMNNEDADRLINLLNSMLPSDERPGGKKFIKYILSNLICLQCKHEYNQKPRKTLLGFRKFTCNECGTENLYPLSKIYKNIYIVSLIFFGLMFIFGFINGLIIIPGIIIVIGVIVLLKNRKLESKIVNYFVNFVK